MQIFISIDEHHPWSWTEGFNKNQLFTDCETKKEFHQIKINKD